MSRPAPAPSRAPAVPSPGLRAAPSQTVRMVVLNRTGAPPLRLRATLLDARRTVCGADLVEVSLWAREPVGWALSIAAKPAGAGGVVTAEAHLFDNFDAVCVRLEAWALPPPPPPVAWRASWTADTAADALCARLLAARRQATVERFVGEVLADWSSAIPAGA